MSEPRRGLWKADVDGHVRIGTFIRENVGRIAEEWTRFAGTRWPAGSRMTKYALKDHIEEILAFIADDLESFQTKSAQAQKSKGEGPKAVGIDGSAAELHAGLRLYDGFDLDQMVSEYRALRATVTRLWTENNNTSESSALTELIRFNESVDQAMTESINHFVKLIDRSRNLLLGILGHDLRGPIAAASLSAELMLKRGTADANQAALAVQIRDCSIRATRVLDDLLDVTHMQFGSELPVSKSNVDLSLLAQQLVAELRSLHPGRDVVIQVAGDVTGSFDFVRMGQVLSNLIDNAVEHGLEGSRVDVRVEGELQEIILSVHNEGIPIPSERIDAIFDAFVRGQDENETRKVGSAHVGLGLYITRSIIESHGGQISVASSADSGTKFTARLPRH